MVFIRNSGSIIFHRIYLVGSKEFQILGKDRVFGWNFCEFWKSELVFLKGGIEKEIAVLWLRSNLQMEMEMGKFVYSLACFTCLGIEMEIANGNGNGKVCVFTCLFYLFGNWNGDCNVWNWRMKLKLKMKMKLKLKVRVFTCLFHLSHSFFLQRSLMLNFVHFSGIVHVFQEHVCGHCFCENVHDGAFL